MPNYGGSVFIDVLKRCCSAVIVGAITVFLLDVPLKPSDANHSNIPTYARKRTESHIVAYCMFRR